MISRSTSWKALTARAAPIVKGTVKPTIICRPAHCIFLPQLTAALPICSIERVIICKRIAVSADARFSALPAVFMTLAIPLPASPTFLYSAEMAAARRLISSISAPCFLKAFVIVLNDAPKPREEDASALSSCPAASRTCIIC